MVQLLTVTVNSTTWCDVMTTCILCLYACMYMCVCVCACMLGGGGCVFCTCCTAAIDII